MHRVAESPLLLYFLREGLMKKHDFRDKKVLITGAAGGIGSALSEEFAKRGAQLALCGLPAEKKKLTEMAARFKKEYGTTTWLFPLDLAAKGGPDKLHSAVKKKVGDVYAVVNNAGAVAYGRVWELPWGPQEKTLTVNLAVPLRMMYLFIPDMVKRGSGVIFNTASVQAFQPTPYHTVYCATKAGLQMLSEGIRAELIGTGVSGLHPQSPLHRHGHAQDQGVSEADPFL